MKMYHKELIKNMDGKNRKKIQTTTIVCNVVQTVKSEAVLIYFSINYDFFFIL